jgi:oxaloacetate decarboxylase (Na+ extruding) subunit alpha
MLFGIWILDIRNQELLMNQVSFVDTTFRDGHSSLWAESMTTGMMLPVAAQMDEAGFRSIELIATSHFKKCVRELREDPWERIKLVAKKVTRTPLTLMMHHSITAFDLTPFSLLKLFMERIAAAGITEVQLMDAANDMKFFRVAETVRFAREAGLAVSMALIYSYSPKHSDAYFAQRTHDAAKLKPDVIYLKDSGGLLTPDRARTVIPAMLAETEGIPLELHSHCTTGLAPLCYLEAVKAGCRTLHTAIPPLANGSSQPSLFNVIKNLRMLGYDPAVDEELLQPVSRHFTCIAKREGFPIGVPLEYDEYQYIHQVPGGVISNLKHQLRQMRMEDRLKDVLEEIVRVKEDLGYPIMVTPFSQFVASQAAINIMTGERYKQVTDEIIMYCLGFWGLEASSEVNPDIKDRILAIPRAKELATFEPPQPSLEEVRRNLGGSSVSDDDLILRYIIQEEKEIRTMRAAGPPKAYFTSANPLVMIIHELLKRGELGYVHVGKGDFSLTLQKHG